MELSIPEFNPAALVSRIRAGDTAAEDEFVARYSRGVLAILRRTAGRSALDDLYQEVFLRAIEKIRAGELREPEKLSGFVCAMARNIAFDYIRRYGAAGSQPGSDSETRVTDAAAGPLDRVLQEEDDRCVRRLLLEMGSDRDRQVLLRFYISEDDKEEICADLKLTSLQFNRVLHRARERFRELYERAAGGLRAGARRPDLLRPPARKR
jgi:RNA polymerase sigma-70 factor (ECF subfamily)